MKIKIFTIVFLSFLFAGSANAQVIIKILNPHEHVVPYQIKIGRQLFASDTNGTVKFSERQFQELKDQHLSIMITDKQSRDFYDGLTLCKGVDCCYEPASKDAIPIFDLTLRKLQAYHLKTFYFNLNKVAEMNISLPNLKSG